MPATTRASSTLNSSAPTTMPSSPKGIRKRNKRRSTFFRNAAMPSKSISSSTGIKMAAAWGTVTASAIIGTAREPKPAPKPLLLTPSSSTAGMATA
jgi:hypothetical protein